MTMTFLLSVVCLFSPAYSFLEGQADAEGEAAFLDSQRALAKIGIPTNCALVNGQLLMGGSDAGRAVFSSVLAQSRGVISAVYREELVQVSQPRKIQALDFFFFFCA